METIIEHLTNKIQFMEAPKRPMCDFDRGSLYELKIIRDIIDKNKMEFNDNQQIVLEWLKSDDHPNYSNILDLFSDLLDYQVPIEVADAFTQMMTDKRQQFQVLAAFAEWGMSEVVE